MVTVFSEPTKNLSETFIFNKTVEKICKPLCNSEIKYTGYCHSPCKSICPENCQDSVLEQEPTNSIDNNMNNHQHKTSSILIAMLSLIGATLLIFCLYIAYVKFSNLRRRQMERQRLQHPRMIQTHERDDEDEHQRTVVDHPIWYIRTVGLQPSVINSIMVFKYKKGEGLIEGTECSVCLTEFGEDETLRLLPKCSHAFHVHCIDTWLRSHTNCPMCRAPIVWNSVSRVAQTVQQDTGNVNPTGGEGIVEGSPREIDGYNQDMEFGVQELRTGVEGDGELDNKGEVKQVRRSVSFNCSTDLKISLAVSNVMPVPLPKSSRVEKFSGKSSGDKLKRVGSSSGRSLQNGPSFKRRSLSLSGHILQPGYSRNPSSVLPL